MEDSLATSPLQFTDDYFASRTSTNDTINEESSSGLDEPDRIQHKSLRRAPSIISLSLDPDRDTGIIFNELRTVPTSGMCLENAQFDTSSVSRSDSLQNIIQDAESTVRSSASSMLNSTFHNDYDLTQELPNGLLQTGFPYEFDLITETSDDDPELGNFFNKQRHYFIISSAGKPIYSMHGSQDLLVVYSGVIQTVVSFFEYSSTPQNIKTVESFDKSTGKPIKFVFLNKSPIILMSIVKNNNVTPVIELQQQLDFIYSFLLSALSKPYIEKVFTKYANFDLRNLLGTTDMATIDSICEDLSNDHNISLIMGGLNCLRMHDSVRTQLQNKMIKMKTPELLYGLIIGPSEKLISIIRPKRHRLHTSDTMILFEMIYNTNVFKTKNEEGDMELVTSETFWVPICLPKFNSSGHLYTLLQFHQLNDKRYFDLHNLDHPTQHFSPDDTKIGIVLMSPYKDAFGQMRNISNEITREILFNKKTFKDLWNSMAGNGRVMVDSVISSPSSKNSVAQVASTQNMSRRATFSSFMSALIPNPKPNMQHILQSDDEIVHFAIKNKRLVQYVFPESTKFDVNDKKIRQNLLFVYKYIKMKLQQTCSDMIPDEETAEASDNVQNSLVYDTWISKSDEETLVTFGCRIGIYEIYVIAKGDIVDQNKLLDTSMQILKWCRRQERRIFIT